MIPKAAEWEKLSDEEKADAIFYELLVIEVSKYDPVFKAGLDEAIVAWSGHSDALGQGPLLFFRELGSLVALGRISMEPIRQKAKEMADLDYIDLLKELALLDRAAKAQALARGKPACAGK